MHRLACSFYPDDDDKDRRKDKDNKIGQFFLPVDVQTMCSFNEDNYDNYDDNVTMMMTTMTMTMILMISGK